jgi:hypothetical protein
MKCEYSLLSVFYDAGIPSKPRSFAVTEPKTGCFELKWKIPEFDGGKPVISYKIKINNTDVASLPADTLQYTTLNQTPGHPYDITVSAVNDIGEGPFVTCELNKNLPKAAYIFVILIF